MILTRLLSSFTTEGSFAIPIAQNDRAVSPDERTVVKIMVRFIVKHYILCMNCRKRTVPVVRTITEPPLGKGESQ